MRPPPGAPSRKFEPFSRNHREQLALGLAGKGDKKTSKSKARITVTVRKRPLTLQESQKTELDILVVPTRKVIRVDEPRKNVTGQAYTEAHEFHFDRVYDEHCTNLEVYNSCVKTLVDAIFESGGRCSCFAYGQTGSGKTYTMVGPKKFGKGNACPPEHRGLWEWAAVDLIDWVRRPQWKSYGLFCSFFEIYCNKVFDLLDNRKQVRALETKTADGVVVKDLTTTRVEDDAIMLSLMEKGLQARVVAKNSRNTDSSRGHAIFTVEVKHLEQQQSHGKLAFIDLAGSERGADSMQSGRTTQQDGAGINRSLLALKECIRALDQGSSHVPFRDSELTKVLRDMFITESALTLMIANVSPTDSCCEQTLNTLRYADRVYQMRQNCRPCINEASLDGDDDQVVSDIGGGDEAGVGGGNESPASVPDRGGEEASLDNQSVLSASDEYPRPVAAEVNERQNSDSKTKKSMGGRRDKVQKGGGGYPRLPYNESRLIDDSGDERSVTTRKYNQPRPLSQPHSVMGGALPGGGLSRTSLLRPVSPRGQAPTRLRLESDTGNDLLTAPFTTRPSRTPESLTVRRPPRKVQASKALPLTQRPTSAGEAVPRLCTDKKKISVSSSKYKTLMDGGSSVSPIGRRLQPIVTKTSTSISSASSSGDHSGAPAAFPKKREVFDAAAEVSDVESLASSALYSDTTPADPFASSSQPRASASNDIALMRVGGVKAASDSATNQSFLRSHTSRTANSYNNVYNPEPTENKRRTSNRRTRTDLASSGANDATNLAEVAQILSQPVLPESKRSVTELVRPEILDSVRKILPPQSSESVSTSLTDFTDEELRILTASSGNEAWNSFTDLVEDQHKMLTMSVALTCEHIKLLRELDHLVEPRKGNNSVKTVNVEPKKLEDIRNLLEQQLAVILSLGDILGKAESAIHTAHKYDVELKRRSMQGLHFYQSSGGVSDGRLGRGPRAARSSRASEMVQPR